MFVITLKKHEKWKVNESLGKVKSKMVDSIIMWREQRWSVCCGVRSV